MRFEKISREQWEKDAPEWAWGLYDQIKLPTRATKGSAGYDFFSPFEFYLPENRSALIPTGIKVYLDQGKYLCIVPRSGLGFKHGMRLANTCGIIDADYVDNPTNEGHIRAKIINEGLKGEMKIGVGDAFMQGIIAQYYITDDDNATQEREGGIGSTDKRKES